MFAGTREDHREMPAALRALDLPPPFRPVMLREAGDAFAHARSHAAQLGAGALVFVGRFDLAVFAVVLEPEEPLAAARRSFYAGMTALAETLAALAPPETPIAFDWPDAIAIDGGLVGGGRLAWPVECGEDAVPDWLVFGAVIRLVWMRSGFAPPARSATALAEEGFGIIDAGRLAEGFARHLMLAFDKWREGRFADIAADYLTRMRISGARRAAIDPRGNLRLEQPGAAARVLDLTTALAAPSWLDPETGEPRAVLEPAL